MSILYVTVFYPKVLITLISQKIIIIGFILISISAILGSVGLVVIKKLTR